MVCLCNLVVDEISKTCLKTGIYYIDLLPKYIFLCCCKGAYIYEYLTIH